MMASLPSERMHLSIPDFNSYCALGMTISDSDNFLIAESSIWWVVLSDSTNVFFFGRVSRGVEVWINRMYTLPDTNLKGHDHGPRANFFTESYRSWDSKSKNCLSCLL